MATPGVKGYEVKFIPWERRVTDRRAVSIRVTLPPGQRKDRRKSGGRRGEAVRRPPNFTAQVALAALRGDKTTEELARQFDVHPDQIANWKNWMLDWMTQVFSQTEPGAPQDKN